MKYSLQTLLMLLATLFPVMQFASVAMAQNRDKGVELILDDQDEDHDDDDDVEADDEHPGIRIRVNGEEFELNDEQMEEFGKKVESFFEGNSEELEEWAERHAQEWESWAEKFESKMERWAERSEEQWEEWAEKYSSRWKNWGDRLEAGEIDSEELGSLLENNLEMLSEMPLGDLIDGALKNSLGELSDAPLDSLDELGDILGGAIEQSLSALEEELAGGLELNIEMGNKGGKNLSTALSKLQDSIEKKRNQLEQDADKKLARMTELLKRKEDLDDDDIAKILEKVKAEIAESTKKELEREQQKLKGLGNRAFAEKSARSRRQKAMKEAEMARELQQQIREEIAEERNNARKAQREMAEAMRQMSGKKKAGEKSEMDSLEAIYRQLKEEKESLETKETEIEKMRREIRELREEIQQLKDRDQ